MELLGNIVRLRAIENEDMILLKDLLNSREIENMTVGINFPISNYTQQRWFENFNYNSQLRYIIEMINTKVALGTIGLVKIDWINRSGEFFIKIQKESSIRIKGDVDEAFQLLLDYAFNSLNLNCVSSTILDYNFASLKAHKRNGFKEEGCLKKRIYKMGEYRDLISLSILKTDFSQMIKG